MTEKFYKIGKIGRPHGINGEVQMFFSDDIFDQTDAEYLMLMVDGLLVPFFLEEYRFKSDETALVKFEDINTKEQAQRITNCEVFFPRQAAKAADHYSWDMLVGYTIISAGKAIGTIEAIDTSTENYLFEVGEHLIPAVDEWIDSIDQDQCTIAMTLPEGLL